MPDPIEITEADLFEKIGRLVVEIDALRQVLAAKESDARTAQASTAPSSDSAKQ